MVEIRHRVGVRAPAADVYRALTTAEGVAGWWATGASGDGGPRGRLAAPFPPVAEPYLLDVLAADPGAHVRWRVAQGPEEWLGTDGRGAHPLYRALTQAPDAGGKAGRVQWNFEKFLVHPDGSVRRFRPRTTPDAPEVVEAIEEYLRAGTRDA